MRKIKIFIQDKFIASKDFSPDMVLTYLGLRKIITKDIDDYYVSIGLLSYTILQKQVVNQLITNSLITGLKDLISNKHIIHKDCGDKLKRRSNEYVLDLSNLQIDKVKSKDNKEYYSAIELDHVVKILNSKLKEKLPLLKFYCYLMTTVTKTGDKVGVGFTPYQDMVFNTGICRQTISKYMDVLYEMNIIHIYRSKDAVLLEPNTIREIPNAYGDISNKEKIINVGKTHEESYGINAKKIQSTKKSSTRSASAKFNILCKDLNESGEIRYSTEELKDIYETLVDYNKRYSYDDSLQKDLSIFSNFDFYKEV